MADRPDAPDPSAPERNPLGLGPRDPEGSNTGSTADTSYNARGSDPYATGEPLAGLDARPPGEGGPTLDPERRDPDEP